MLRQILSLGLIIMLFQVQAQSDYLVTAKGDTLRGEVKILTFDRLDKAQISLDGKKKIFTALQARTISVRNQIYRTAQTESRISFMQLLKDGYLGLYAFRLPGQLNYDGRYLIKRDGQSMEVPNIGFRKGMMGFLYECPEIQEKIRNNDLQKKDIEEIIDQFNKCLLEKPVLQNTATNKSTTVVTDNEKVKAIKALIIRVEQMEPLANKKDALDLLKDIKEKAEKNETIPNYLSEGLKSFLINSPELTGDLEKVLALIKNQ